MSTVKEINGIALAASGGGITWTVITANQTAAINNGYICNKAGTLTLTLPTTAAAGSVIGVSNMHATGIFTIAQPNAGSKIHVGDLTSTTGTGGSVSNITITGQYDGCMLVCNVANDEWLVTGVQGVLSVV